MSSHAIERSFDWATFVDRYWDQRPVLYTKRSAVPFERSEIFDAAVAAGRTIRDGYPLAAAPSTVVFTIDRFQQTAPRPWAPSARDGSFDGYHARMSRELAARRYALIVNAFHSFSFRLWSRERAFFDGLWRRVGLPSTGAITTLFHGNYEHTPVGAHKDRFSTFLFAVDGRKRMRFWPKKPWADGPTTVLDYAPYLDSSFVVEVEPGDALYWPSTYFHVGESVGGDVATSVNVGIPRTEHRAMYDLQELLVDIDDAATFADPSDRMARVLQKSRAPALAKGVVGADGSLAPALPAALERCVTQLRAITGAARMNARLRTVSLRHLSATGFAPVPPAARRRRIAADDWISGDPRCPILWAPEGANACLCAANGHSVRVASPAKKVARVVEALNTGLPTRAGDLGSRSLLESLASFRAITRLPREAAT